MAWLHAGIVGAQLIALGLHLHDQFLRRRQTFLIKKYKVEEEHARHMAEVEHGIILKTLEEGVTKKDESSAGSSDHYMSSATNMSKNI